MSSQLETASVTRVIEPLNGRALLLVSSGKTKGLAKKREIKNLAVIKKFSPRLRRKSKMFLLYRALLYLALSSKKHSDYFIIF